MRFQPDRHSAPLNFECESLKRGPWRDKVYLVRLSAVPEWIGHAESESAAEAWHSYVLVSYGA